MTVYEPNFDSFKLSFGDLNITVCSVTIFLFSELKADPVYEVSWINVENEKWKKKRITENEQR